MKSVTLVTILAFALFFAYVHADCDDSAQSNEDGDVKQFFKNLGCKIQKGAENLQENAKPWAEKIGTSAKEFGNTVAQKYDELKHKLTDENDSNGPSTPFPVANAPTEKVPLAPLSGEAAASSSNPAVAAPVPAAGKGEPADTIPNTPLSIDDRFLFQTHECRKGEAVDQRRQCPPNV